MKSAVIFIAGAVVGSITAWYLSKRYYKRIADEEIASVKERYSKRATEEKEDKIVEEKSAPDTSESDAEIKAKYEEIIKTSKYSSYAKGISPERVDGVDYITEEQEEYIRFIEDDEYGYSNYTESWDYFVGDDRMINELGEIVDDVTIAEEIGIDWKDRALNCGYEKIYIRNSRMAIDYEIVVNYGRYQQDERDEVGDDE